MKKRCQVELLRGLVASKVVNVCVTHKNLVYDLARHESPSDISGTFIETPALSLKAN